MESLSSLSFRKLIARVFAQSFVYGLGQGLEKITRFLLIPIYLRFLTPEDFGIVTLARLATSFVVGILTLCLESAVTRFYYDWKAQGIDRTAAGTVWIASVAWGAAVTCVVVFFGQPVFGVLCRRVAFDPYIRISLWTMGATCLIAVPRKLIRMQERPLLYTVLSYLQMLLGLGLTIYYVVIRRDGAIGVLKAAFVGNLVCLTPYIIVTLRSSALRFSLPVLKDSLRFCLPLVPGFYVKSVASVADNFLLEKFVGLREVGLYSIARSLTNLIKEGATAIKTAWIPFYMRVVKERTDYRVIISRSTTYYSVTMALICMALAVFAREIIIFLGRQAYVGAVVYVPVLVLAAFILVHEVILECGILVAKKTHYLSWVPCIQAATVLGLGLLLLPRYGAWGAAWSVVFADIVSTVVLYRLSVRVFPIPFEKGQILTVALAGVVLFIAMNWILAHRTLFTDVEASLLKTTFLVGYAGVLGHNMGLRLNHLRQIVTSPRHFFTP